MKPLQEWSGIGIGTGTVRMDLNDQNGPGTFWGEISFHPSQFRVKQNEIDSCNKSCNRIRTHGCLRSREEPRAAVRGRLHATEYRVGFWRGVVDPRREKKALNQKQWRLEKSAFWDVDGIHAQCGSNATRMLLLPLCILPREDNVSLVLEKTYSYKLRGFLIEFKRKSRKIDCRRGSLIGR